jgi:hypothetical protein
VETGGCHKYDLFEKFLAESRTILDVDPAKAAYKANQEFGLNLTKYWFTDFNMRYEI